MAIVLLINLYSIHNPQSDNKLKSLFFAKQYGFQRISDCDSEKIYPKSNVCCVISICDL